MKTNFLSRAKHHVKVAKGVDLSSLDSCDQEPIRKPAKIQANGVLLIFVDLRYPPIAYSDNLFEYFQSEEHSFDTIEDLQLDKLFAPADVVRLHKSLIASEKNARPTSLQIQPLFTNLYPAFLCLCHRVQKFTFFEFLPASSCDNTIIIDDESIPFEIYLAELMSRTQLLQHNISDKLDCIGELGRYYVESLQKITGFDRVKLYRFLPDWSGTVIAEAVNPSIKATSYLGLQFPESDIPSQAGALYQLTPFRYIPDTDAEPIPLVNAQGLHPGNAARDVLSLDHLDMSLCYLRSISPIHIQYLRNMDVKASASFSIVVNGKLWGLIVCHHSSPNAITYSKLVQSSIAVQQLANALMARLQGEMLLMHHQIAGVFRRLSADMNREADIIQALQQNGQLLMELCGATGFAVCVEKAYVRVGKLPSDQTLMMLSQWLEPKMQGGHFSTDNLVAHLPVISSDVASVAGILAIGGVLDHGSASVAFKLVWCRGEVVRKVNWAGQPAKEMAVRTSAAHAGQIPDHLWPRTSFAHWQEEQRGYCHR